jgi:hypothetical protein
VTRAVQMDSNEAFVNYRESRKRNYHEMEKVEDKLFGTAPRALWLFGAALEAVFDRNPPATLSALGAAQGYEAQAQRLAEQWTGMDRRRKGHVAGRVHILSAIRRILHSDKMDKAPRTGHAGP